MQGGTARPNPAVERGRGRQRKWVALGRIRGPSRAWPWTAGIAVWGEPPGILTQDEQRFGQRLVADVRLRRDDVISKRIVNVD